MANTITTTSVLNGSRVYVATVNISGDGSGDETAAVLIDVSALGCTGFAIDKLWWSLTGFSARLNFDASADVPGIELAEGTGGIDFKEIGGAPVNYAGSGITGDILLATTGLGSGEKGTIRIEGRKK